MIDKLTVLPGTFAQDVADLRSWAAAGIERRHITRRQFTAIEMLARKHLPCYVELLQRAPNSVKYLHINNHLEYRIGQRAQMFDGRPQKIV